MTYEYACDSGHHFDLSRMIAERNDPCDCPLCGSAGHRVVTAPSGRVSAFSTSESDFQPHFNRAFGRRVESLAHMRALQQAHGTADVGVTGDAAEKYVPRDIGRRFKRHGELREQLAAGQTVFEPKGEDGRPSGVRIDISAQTEKD